MTPGPSSYVKALLAGIQGHMFYTSTDIVAGGAGTARTAINAAFQVPDAAKMCLGYRPVDYVDDAAANESIAAVFDLAGNNYKAQPQEVFGGNTANSILADSAGMLHAPSEYYDVFNPVNGGELWDVGIEPVDAIAGNRRSGIEFCWSDQRLNFPVIYSQASREIATGTAAGIVAGTTLQINNSHAMVEAGGIVTNATTVVELELILQLVLKCTAWKPIQEQRLTFEPCGTIADLTTDNGSSLAYVSRRSMKVSFTSDRATVTADFDIDQSISTAGQMAHYIRWI